MAIGRIVVAASALLAAGLVASPATAGVYGDDFARCLAAKTSEGDRTGFAQWTFAAMSSSPMVEPLSKVTAEDRARLNKSAAALIERLVHVDCRKEAVAALKYESGSVLESSFSFLGQIAMKDLMAHPSVTAEMEKFATYSDQAKWTALAKEAGVPVVEPAPAPSGE